ncbi:MAG TPA: hypothetical protein VET26_10565 [Candidatus Sulfotelmatobacter sp.]|nr:hypothetical protein [Candidatus Sulfotelmatobacter sp.]
MREDVHADRVRREEMSDNRQSRVEPQVQPHQTSFWPEMDQYRHRFDEIQAEFVEEPRAAVEKAEKLIEEAVQKITGSIHEHLQRIHGDIAKESDTERLRLAMRSYRDFIDSFGGRRAA